MAVFRRGNTWKAEVFRDGRRVASKSGFQRQKEAREWHDQQRLTDSVTVKPKDHTFEELLEHFKVWHLQSIRHGTRVRYLVDIEQRIEPFFRYMKLDRIDARMIEDFKAECSKTLSPKSVNNCLHTLRLMLNKAVKWKMLTENPYATESLAVPEQPYPWWSEEEHIQRFLEAARESRYFGVYLLALETGMRYGEIVGLSPKDVDLENGVIHVHRQWLERQRTYGPPKHGKERWIDFQADGALGSLLRSQKAVHHDRLFTTATGAIPTKGGLADKFFKACIRRAKVPEICFHGLRHTFASWYMIRHDNVWDLSAILGHSSIKTTMRYAHHSKRARRKPLDMASFVTPVSRLETTSNQVTGDNCSGKEWRDGRDLNPYPSLKLSV